MNASLVIFLDAGFGGVPRHLINGWISRLVGPEFPLGILAINVIGSCAMGLVAGGLRTGDKQHRNCAYS